MQLIATLVAGKQYVHFDEKCILNAMLKHTMMRMHYFRTQYIASATNVFLSRSYLLL